MSNAYIHPYPRLAVRREMRVGIIGPEGNGVSSAIPFCDKWQRRLRDEAPSSLALPTNSSHDVSADTLLLSLIYDRPPTGRKTEEGFFIFKEAELGIRPESGGESGLTVIVLEVNNN